MMNEDDETAIEFRGVNIHDLSRERLIEALEVGFDELSALRNSQSEEGRAAATLEEELHRSLRAQNDYFGAVGEYQSRLMDAAAAYNQIIILGGYAAFFGVWSAVQEDIPRWILLSSGATIIISLVFFIGWTVFNMFQLQTQNMKTLATFSGGVDGFEGRFRASIADALQEMGWYQKLWPYVVISASGTALIAALLLSWGALASIFDSEKEGQLHSVVPTKPSENLPKPTSSPKLYSATPANNDISSQKSRP